MKTITMTTLAALLLSTSLAPAEAASTDTDGDGVPDISEPLLHTDPMNPDTDGDGVTDLADADPVSADSPIVEGGAPATYRIGELLVENNYDPATRSDAPDHLEIQVLNDGPADLTALTVYYTITDADSGARKATSTIPRSPFQRVETTASMSTKARRPAICAPIPIPFM
jgi:hypothetical protein